MKKLLKMFVFGVFMIGLVCIPSMAAAQETSFLTPKGYDYLPGINKKNQLNTTYGGERLKFIEYTRDGLLKLMSRDNNNDYLSFTNFDGKDYNSGVTYGIRKIETINPKMTFFEITASRGAHGKNCGYWIIGKHNGQWVTYISLDNLAAMGYTSGKWHTIQTNINSDGTGRLIFISSHTYMPPGAKYGYQSRSVNDFKIQLFWDQDAQWFGMKSLENLS